MSHKYLDCYPVNAGFWVLENVGPESLNVIFFVKEGATLGDVDIVKRGVVLHPGEKAKADSEPFDIRVSIM